MKPRLDQYDNSTFDPGASLPTRLLWYIVNGVVFDTYFFPSSVLKVRLLRYFGAQIGRGVVLKPRVRIKFPWRLVIGDHSWIGEDVWIDNLAMVEIADNVCVSQGVYICTGNHDYKNPEFGLLLGAVKMASGSWAGARSVICPGAYVEENAVIAVGSVLVGVASKDGIYQGNPATRKATRTKNFAPSS